LAEEWRSSLAWVAEEVGDEAPGQHPAFAQLPPVARRLANLAWLERFITCFDDLSDAVACGELQLACTGEEVAFQILLAECRSLAEEVDLDLPAGVGACPGHGDAFDFDWERVEELICWDLDVCWLWQPDLDGIEDDQGAEHMLVKPVNLHPRAWFEAFDGARRRPAPGPSWPLA
jgi:hypothetical protein